MISPTSRRCVAKWAEGTPGVAKVSRKVVAFFGKAHPFSNFHPCRFVVAGEEYSCVEQFMMAEKARLFGDVATLREIMRASTPLAMKRLGRKVTPFDAARWDEVSKAVVLRALLAKFVQDAELGNALLATGDALLVEASPRDRLWGAGMGRAAVESAVAEGKPLRGRNRLGELLMATRKAIAGEEGNGSPPSAAKGSERSGPTIEAE